MSAPQQMPFLERKSYRQRRLVDGARLLPFAGAVGFLIPLMWPADVSSGADTARGGLYLFAVWFLLIAAAFALARRLRGPETENSTRG
jgi:hypothetical protein